MKTLAINVHDQSDSSPKDVERKHYTVAILIAELRRYDPNADVVIKNLNTGTFGSIDFHGLTPIREEEGEK